jgi:trimeric autotransporter adhesin
LVTETAVNYAIPESVNNASLTIYDLTGKQVLSIPITTRGKGSTTIKGEYLSPGIYIYGIIADNKLIDSKKMIVNGQ